VSDRLKVFVVGLSHEDLTALRTRLAPDAFDVVGQGLVADVRSGLTVIPRAVDALLLTPQAQAHERVSTASSVTRGVRPLAATDEPLLEQLTPRERTVLALVADGLPNREIAHELEISEHTVKFHLASIFGKLAVSSRTEAVRRGLQLGLIEI
jgi:DNA-binding NarL/FixJ family response regulator